MGNSADHAEAAEQAHHSQAAAARHHHRLGRPRAAVLHRGARHRPPQLARRHAGRQGADGVRGAQASGAPEALRAAAQRGPGHGERDGRRRGAGFNGVLRRQCLGLVRRGLVGLVLRGHAGQARVHRPPDAQAQAPPGPDRGGRHHGVGARGQRLHEGRGQAARDRPAQEAQAGSLRAAHVAAVARPADRSDPRGHALDRARDQFRQRQPADRCVARHGRARGQLPGHAHRRVHGQHAPGAGRNREAHVRADVGAGERFLQQRIAVQFDRGPEPEPGLRLQGCGDRHGLLLLRAAVPGQSRHHARAERGAAQPGREFAGAHFGPQDGRSARDFEADVGDFHGCALSGRRFEAPGGNYALQREAGGVASGEEDSVRRRGGSALAVPFLRERSPESRR
ncbi:hypothetical protein MPTK2_1g05200 [Marchantia polymorpha subsp. ruderalis]